MPCFLHFTAQPVETALALHRQQCPGLDSRSGKGVSAHQPATNYMNHRLHQIQVPECQIQPTEARLVEEGTEIKKERHQKGLIVSGVHWY